MYVCGLSPPKRLDWFGLISKKYRIKVLYFIFRKSGKINTKYLKQKSSNIRLKNSGNIKLPILMIVTKVISNFLFKTVYFLQAKLVQNCPYPFVRQSVCKSPTLVIRKSPKLMDGLSWNCQEICPKVSSCTSDKKFQCHSVSKSVSHQYVCL